MAEIPRIDGVQLSPDGRWVVYAVIRPSLEKNASVTDHLLQPVPQEDRGLPEPVKLPDSAAAVRWHPDGRHLSMLLNQPDGSSSFVLYDISTGRTTPITSNKIPPLYKWSPRGTFVAFAAPLELDAGLDARRGIGQKSIETNKPAALFVLEVASGMVTQVTSGSLRVPTYSSAIGRSPSVFAWSPDERAFAVSVVPRENVANFNGDLIIVDRVRGTVRPLVTRPGMDISPVWSPDGKWIAFSTHDGIPRGHIDTLGRVAVISTGGGAITTFESDSLPSSNLTNGWWSADSAAFHWIGPVDMTMRIGRASVRTRTAALLPAPADELPLPHDSNHSVSNDGRWMAYTRESMTMPPELFIVKLDAGANPIGTPRQLTRLSRDFPLSRRVKNEALSWKSQDGKFTIHGILLTPAGAGGEGHAAQRLPTLVYFNGGPSMFMRGFAMEAQGGAPLALAARGYVVLIPNTRGRGGYGRAFAEAIGTEKSAAKSPLADALAGVDMLIARGISDPDRLGILGHSYGGYMTAYAVTATRRFKAAVIHEGMMNLLASNYIGYQKGSTSDLLMRDLSGIHDPFDPAERARMIAESPLLNADRVITPTLTSCGIEGNGKRGGDCEPWFNALRRFGVASAYFLYDDAHRYKRPAAIADDLTRTAEWLDYWVRGIPFPDAHRAREYMEWQAAASAVPE